MSEVIQNTIYVLTQGSYLSKDGETIVISVAREGRAKIPMHLIQGVVAFGEVSVSPFLLHALADRGISVTFLSFSGKLLCRVDAPGSGNVLLRRAQFRLADSMDAAAKISKSIVAGKIHNSRSMLMRAARDLSEASDAYGFVRTAAQELSAVLPYLEKAESLDEIRGFEGRAAERYFGALPWMLKQQREDFSFTVRTRRPPLDPVNAMLSFGYSLLLNDCVAALTAVGLDPSVGFLHTDRPGRPSLALDLMEEFRAALVDRMVVRLINRREVTKDKFVVREGGAVEMDDTARRVLIDSYQERKKEEIAHPLLNQNSRIGLLPFLQAKILARHIRGDLPDYLPCLPRN